MQSLLKEYLNHLNIALGSCGEFHSCYESFRKAGQITDEQYDVITMLKAIPRCYVKDRDKRESITKRDMHLNGGFISHFHEISDIRIPIQ